jgi:phosphatidylserine decarboxylase
MRLPLTKYGWPQVLFFPAIVLTVMAVCLVVGIWFWPAWATYSLEAILAVLLIWVLSFFRDPYRPVPADISLLLAPADGKITDIEILGGDNISQKDDNTQNLEAGFVGGPALRIGIFLNIFNVHINRAPCNVKVEKITYKKGRHKNAMSPDSGRANESNDLWLTRTDEPEDKLILRQISGAIAQRIVCKASEGQNLTGGEKFGMIKFGSRTELYLFAHDNAKCLVKIGDKVKAGITPLVRYE